MCPNCGAQITCGCQNRTASNGATVCSNCVALYEEQLKYQNTANEKSTGEQN